ncbi:MAG: hypothetical protein DRH08_03890 [Deltaproteobacteria bacterium]|nr:MAG: hypothetical protein DRH08_03890 [Deltaproteobacteria bacterium]
MKTNKKSETYTRRASTLGFLMIITLTVMIGGSSVALAQLEGIEKPKLTEPGVFTLQGEFVRMAYNGEGFVTLGYRTANSSVGDEWLLLEMGITLRNKVKEQTLTREDLTILTPSGKTIPLAPQKDFSAANLMALDRRANLVRDSINYFPLGARHACTLHFFSDLSGHGRTIAYDQVSLNYQRACVGRIYFHIPDGIEVGQHFLNVKFAESTVQVPFRIFTKAEEKEFRKMWKTLKQEHEEGFGQE